MGVTFRSIVIGLVLIPFNALWLASMEVVWISGQSTTLSLFYHVIFILFWLILVNLAVEKLKPDWALKATEILVIYTMLSLASAMGSLDMIDVLIPMLAFLHYFEPLEHYYGEVIDHVPAWLVVRDPTALKSYYLGQESIFEPANLVPWLRPLAWWFAFMMAVCAVLWGLNLLFRKQWTENEKLAYPVIQLPMRLTIETKALLTNELFWVAFAIAAGIDLFNGLNFWFPVLPKIPVVHVVNLQTLFPERPWSDMGWVPVSFYPFAIGMCFFMPLDLAFSCWFFFLFWKVQRILASYFGVHGMPGFPFIEEQTAGGYYAIALTALWISRRQLARAARMLLGLPVDDATPWERQEARIAAVLILGGGIYLVWFSVYAHMTPGIAVAFFLLYFLISIAVTRMRAELGPPSHDLHFIGPNFQIVNFLGAGEMRRRNPRDLIMLGFYYWFNRAYRSNPMPHGMEAFRIAERLKMDCRRYLIAMGIAIVAGTICAYAGLLFMLDKYGASQVSGLGEWFGREAWYVVNNWFIAPEPRHVHSTYAILIGLVFALGLAALRMNLTWWPFHPVGYAISGSWSMDQLWAAVLVAWVIKTLLLKYGGAKAYKPAIPFFLGLILGDFIAGSFWNLYGTLRHVPVYHFWPY